MAPASNEEQFKFLISCIRWSNNGKVDFGEVAAECSIVTKGAAAKRYERMMKAHGIAPNAASVKSPSSARAFKSESIAEKPTPSKKRKMDAFVDEQGAADDDEGSIANYTHVKPDPGNGGESLIVKNESDSGLHFDAPNDIKQYLPHLNSGEQDYVSQENSMYNSSSASDYSAAIEAAYSGRLDNPYGDFVELDRSSNEGQVRQNNNDESRSDSILIAD